MRKIIPAVLLFFFVGCETVLDMDLPSNGERLAMNCFFAPDSNWVVNVSRSQSVLASGNIVFVQGADVKLMSNDQVVGTLNYVSDGNYELLNPLPQQLTNYTVEVRVVGFDMVTATSSAPKAVPVTNIDTAYTQVDGQQYRELGIHFKDPASETNYYKVQILARYYNYEYQVDSLGNWIVSDSFPYFSPMSIGSNDPVFTDDKGIDYIGRLFTDEAIDGNNYRLSVYLFEDSYGGYDPSGYDMVFAVLYSLSRDQYLYQSSLQHFNSTNGNPFAQPVQVYGNVQNGFGIFSGYNLAVDSIPLQ